MSRSRSEQPNLHNAMQREREALRARQLIEEMNRKSKGHGHGVVIGDNESDEMKRRHIAAESLVRGVAGTALGTFLAHQMTIIAGMSHNPELAVETAKQLLHPEKLTLAARLFYEASIALPESIELVRRNGTLEAQLERIGMLARSLVAPLLPGGSTLGTCSRDAGLTPEDWTKWTSETDEISLSPLDPDQEAELDDPEQTPT